MWKSHHRKLKLLAKGHLVRSGKVELQILTPESMLLATAASHQALFSDPMPTKRFL